MQIELSFLDFMSFGLIDIYFLSPSFYLNTSGINFSRHYGLAIFCLGIFKHYPVWNCLDILCRQYRRGEVPHTLEGNIAPILFAFNAVTSCWLLLWYLKLLKCPTLIWLSCTSFLEKCLANCN